MPTPRSFFDHSAIRRVSAWALLWTNTDRNDPDYGVEPAHSPRPAGRILIAHPRQQGGTVHAFVEITAGPLTISRPTFPYDNAPVDWPHWTTGSSSGIGAAAAAILAAMSSGGPSAELMACGFVADSVTLDDWRRELEMMGYTVLVVIQ